MAWGHVEITIEMMNVFLHNYFRMPVKDHAFVDFPRGPFKKVNVAKRLLNRDTLFYDLRDKAGTLLDEAIALHEIRVHAVHSVCQGFTGAEELLFFMSDQTKGISSKSVKLTLTGMDAASERMRTIQPELDEIVHEIHRRLIESRALPYARSSPPDRPPPNGE